MKKNTYDVKGIIDYINSKPDIDPYTYDGSYELIQSIVKAYSEMDDISIVDYHDLDCIYLTVVISSSCGIEGKKKSIRNSHLPDEAKNRLIVLANTIWDKTVRQEYLHDDDGAQILGMFGSGFMSFSRTTSSDDAYRFIKMCVDIIQEKDEEKMFNIAEAVLNNGIRGLGAASASVMLHGIRPTVFPVLNGNMGTDNIFEALGINLQKRQDLKHYIRNCRKIKEYKEKNFNFKNYRVIDLCQRDINKFVIHTTVNHINIDILKKVIVQYKKDFKRRIEEENYKWEAVKRFKDNFRIDDDDFAGMLEKSLSLCDNLLTRSYYFPAGVIKEIAQYDPEYARNMFSNLYDESVPVLDRMNQFSKASDIYYQIKDNDKLNTYQDPPAISVYLFLMYPEKYYIYMSTKFEDVAKRLEYGEVPKAGSLERVASYFEMADQIYDYIKSDKELLQLNQSRVDSKCYSDPTNHILTEDIIYFVFRKWDEIINSNDGFWPTYDEYPIDLTKEDWSRFLNEVEYPNHKGSMKVLKCFLDIGGTASPSKLSQKYKAHPMVYTSSVTNMSRRALKYFNLEPCPEGDKVWYFPVAFYGKVGEDDDKGTYVYKMREELKTALLEMNLNEIILEDNKGYDDMAFEIYDKNTILYGPPGTGKTYSTVLYAVGICENKTIEELEKEPYEEVLARYNNLKDEGQISFTTFHQSYGYEDFIEGIKPVLTSDELDEGDSDIKYTIEPGTFKAFCDSASLSSKTRIDLEKLGVNKSPVIWKVSLEGTGDNPTRTECMDNDHIRIGWDSYGENIENEEKYEKGGKSVLNAFYNKMRIGDIVFSCYTQSTIDAIGVITGDCEWKPEYEKYKRLRNVKWLVKEINYNITEINDGANMTLSTVYKMNVSLNDVIGILDKTGVITDKEEENDKNYVYIIDEINRGNISKIFGELITLIEPSKRKGASETMDVVLPYSKTAFSVPNNVYILGTMNTADRSIALMDTALRRRFSFKEMMPEAKVLAGIVVEDSGESIDIARLLEVINLRIEYLYDREHMIGHAYFVPLISNPTLDNLGEIFENNIIPLLKEYFYEDYGKIQLVLGDNSKDSDEYKFIVEDKTNISDIFNGNTSEIDLPEHIYMLNSKALKNIKSYKGISKEL